MRTPFSWVAGRWLARRTPYQVAQAWPRLSAWLPRAVRQTVLRAALRDPRAAMRLTAEHLGGC